MIKYPVLFLLLLLSTRLFAQHLNGTVTDRVSRQPLAYATVTTARATTFASAEGKFTLNGIRPGDTVRVTSIGYTPYTFTVYQSNDTVNIYLEQNSILLNNVSINGARNYKADSLRLRQEYAKQFNYQKPKLKDFLKTNLPTSLHDNHGNAFDNSDAIGGLDLLSVIGFFGRNKTPVAKLQKELQQDEQDNYVDHEFSKAKVSLVTHMNMKGDSLQAFMILYRPTLQQVKTMTDYDLMQYIKSSFTQFLQLYDPKEKSIFSK